MKGLKHETITPKRNHNIRIVTRRLAMGRDQLIERDLSLVGATCRKVDFSVSGQPDSLSSKAQ